ncbi:glutamate receptor ionotropic, kainate glr-3-like [Oratosquilla oratoria]|uniref:glutamate receptor ionotropic, kainate glr-3-like n=1 Tax=Oratosquilla oratoria TaxID=337810 RepID=UPI003F767BC9
MVMYRGDKWHGIMTYFFEMFLQRFKYCYNFVRPADRLWGIRLANGSFNGMMGMLNRKEVDIALGPFGVSYDRSQLADMSHPFMFIDHRIMYPRPQVEPDLRGFYRPFSPISWVVTFSTLLAVFLCLFAIAIITKLAMSDRLQGHPPTFTNILEEGGRIIRWTYGILLSQSMSWTPSQGSGTVLLWIMFSFILSTIYKSNLKAMLILPKITIPFDTVEELVEQDSIEYYILGSTVIHQVLRDAPPGSLYRRAYDKKKGILSGSLTPIAFTLLEEKAAFMTNTLVIKSLMEMAFVKEKDCSQATTREGYLKLFMGVILLPKGSPLVDEVNRVVQAVFEGGLMAWWEDQALRRGSICFNTLATDRKVDLRPLSLEDMYGIFLLYAAGMILAAIVLAFEVINRKVSGEENRE